MRKPSQRWSNTYRGGESISPLSLTGGNYGKTDKYDCAFVDNEMPYGRVPQGHPVIVDYFYHEEIRGTENTGKRNR